MSEKILDNLKELGFNSYEAKVYLSLLKNNPATGYEVSKNSGVPQARAYDTLKALEERQVVVSMGQKPQKYTPIRPEELLDRCEKHFSSSIDFLRQELPDLADDFVEPVLNMHGLEAIFENLITLINQAKEEIFLELWSTDFDRIKEALEDAEKRGLKVNIVGFKNINHNIGLIYEHGLGDILEENLQGRIAVIAVDNHVGMIGLICNEVKASHAVLTKNHAVVFVIKQLILHDMYLLDVESTLGDELHKTYGKDLVKLRDKIAGSNIKLVGH